MAMAATNGAWAKSVPTERFWIGAPPERCDLCEGGFEHLTREEFIDGGTTMGPWANMCMRCFARYGKGIGTGRGQHYRFRALDEKWVKIAG